MAYLGSLVWTNLFIGSKPQVELELEFNVIICIWYSPITVQHPQKLYSNTYEYWGLLELSWSISVPILMHISLFTKLIFFKKNICFGLDGKITDSVLYTTIRDDKLICHSFLNFSNTNARCHLLHCKNYVNWRTLLLICVKHLYWIYSWDISIKLQYMLLYIYIYILLPLTATEGSI